MTADPKGFDEEPEVPDAKPAPADTGSGTAEPKGAGSADQSADAGGQAGSGSADTAAADAQELNNALTAQLEQTRSALTERTGDLQRLQAEFANYRRRVERDREAVKEVAVANLLTELLPVLDDIGRARDHGELSGGFKQVAESLETVAAKMGLVQFGNEGEPFDPTIHEALMHSYAPDVTETTCVQILQPGYRIGERIIRPARVGVAEPQPGAPAKESADADEAEEPAGDSAGDSGAERAGAAEAEAPAGDSSADAADDQPQKENGGAQDG